MFSKIAVASRLVCRQTVASQRRMFCAAAAPQVPEVIATKADFELLQKIAEEMAAKEKKTKHELLTLMAEHDNKRRAHEASRSNIKKKAIADFDVLAKDYLKKVDQAVEIASESLKLENPTQETILALKNQMVHLDNELQALFAKVSIEKISPMDMPFDPSRHEALFRMPDPAKPNDTVAFVMQTGYTIHERVLRAAKVGVVQNNA